jgi:hypothetical protein
MEELENICRLLLSKAIFLPADLTSDNFPFANIFYFPDDQNAITLDWGETDSWRNPKGGENATWKKILGETDSWKNLKWKSRDTISLNGDPEPCSPVLLIPPWLLQRDDYPTCETSGCTSRLRMHF